MITLSNGIQVPDLCFGTGITSYDSRSWKGYLHLMKSYFCNKKQFENDVGLRKMAGTVLSCGCGMFDTSRAYGMSEHILGQVVKNHNRDKICIVTKLCNHDQYENNVRKGFEKSLSELGVDYIDIYLMHWPVKDHYIDNWKEMEKLYQEGKCRAIGVCNCNIHHLEEMKRSVSIMPMINEFECHPLFTQDALRTYCKKNNIQVMAYTSTARMDERLLKTVLVPIAGKYGKSVAQVILRWHQQIGNIPIVNSKKTEHVKQNMDIRDFSLTEGEIDAITQININSRLRYDPDNCDFTQL